MLILGSKSPRRKEILDMACIKYICIPTDADEDVETSDATQYAILTAKKKSLVLKKKYKSDIILTCDTIVYINGEILGKPKTKDECFDMIKKLSGNMHEVITGVVISYPTGEKSFSTVTKVYVDNMTNEEIMDYVNTTEPYDKAGGYAIQGIFAKHIRKIEGDYYNVMGLPLNEVYNSLKEIEKKEGERK